jgi:hypothetical protein
MKGLGLKQPIIPPSGPLGLGAEWKLFPAPNLEPRTTFEIESLAVRPYRIRTCSFMSDRADDFALESVTESIPSSLFPGLLSFIRSLSCAMRRLVIFFVFLIRTLVARSASIPPGFSLWWWQECENNPSVFARASGSIFYDGWTETSHSCSCWRLALH